MRFHVQPHVGEVEVVGLALVPERAQQPPIQRHKVHLGPPAADVKGAVQKPPAGQPASQAAGGQPHPGAGEVAAPVLVRVAEALLRRHRVAPTVVLDPARVVGLHALGVPVHGEGLGVPQRAAGPVAHVEGDPLFKRQRPAQAAGVAHPLRMRRGILRRHGHAPPQRLLPGQAVPRLDPVRGLRVQRHVIPPEEPVQLAVVLAPAPGLHHQIGGPPPRRPVLRQLPQHRRVPAQGRVAQEKLDEKRLVLPRLRVLRGEGMPPPIVPPVPQRPVQHAGVARNVVVIEHTLAPFTPSILPHTRPGFNRCAKKERRSRIGTSVLWRRGRGSNPRPPA